MSESDAFADKTSLICLKNSIIIYIMTLKMTVMLLSSRYRREIKDSKKRRSEMKKRFRERAIAMMVAALIAASPVSGAVFAADEVAVQEQSKPAVSEEIAAEKQEVSNNEAPAEKKVEAPVENKVEAHVENKVDAPAENKAEAPAENTSEGSAEPQAEENSAAGSDNKGSGIEQPEMPEVSGYEDNDKIEDYNRKVDEYNKAAESYNASVDSEYEAAVEETGRRNAEIDAHNESELQRVREAEEKNAKALKDAEEINAGIDEENAAEEAAVNEHNAREDELVRTSEEAKAAAEAENEEITAHNAAVDQYKTDKEKYDADYAQYQADLVMEQKIKALGYASVEQYNELINTHYNEPARASVEKNASAKKVSVSDTYRITEAEEKSGIMIKVHIEHNFEGTDISYVDDFEIDRNDIITLNSIPAVGDATQPGYCCCYYNTDDSHTMGYWSLGWSELMENARYVNSNWNHGNEYEISYKDGANHINDIEDIYMAYNYMWMPQRVYKTYNTPVEPEKPTDPGEKKELKDIPEIYTPEYRQFVQKEHVQAELEEIPEANILENIIAPVKKDYISLLAHMALFEVPVPETPAVTEEPKDEEPEVPAVIEEPKDEEPEVPAVIEEPKNEEPEAPAVIEEPKDEEPEVPAVIEEPKDEEPEAPAIIEEPAIVEEIIESGIPAVPAIVEEPAAEEPEVPAIIEEPKAEEPEVPVAIEEIIESVVPAVPAIVEEPAAEEPEAPAAIEEPKAEEPEAPAVIEEPKAEEPEVPVAIEEIIESVVPAVPAIVEEPAAEEPAVPAAANRTKAVRTADADADEAAVTAAPAPATAEIENTPAPMASPAAVIEDEDVPLAEGSAWALINLILTLVTGLVSAILLVGYFGRKDDEEDEENDEDNTKRKGVARLASIVPAVGSIIAFIITEDMTNPMALTDRWTILMAVILLVQAVIAILAKKSVEDDSDEAEAQAVSI